MTPREQSISIVAEIALKYGVTTEAIFGKTGPRANHNLNAARCAAYSAVKQRKGLSYPAVGRIFGRDHSTIMHGCRKHGHDGIAGVSAGLI